jgi:hypothetical protein
MPEQERKLTDDDVRAIVEQVEAAVALRFYGDIGRGVWSLFKKALLMAIVGFAAYGSFKGVK